jgi:hypothetical protein
MRGACAPWNLWSAIVSITDRRKVCSDLMNPVSRTRLFACLVVAATVLVSVLAYLPAVGNSFISDDFTMIPFVRLTSAHPGELLEVPSEMFRTVSYVYFWLCLKFFGPNPESFYWASIGLHALISLLVGRLILTLSKSSIAASAGAIFFAAYERHHEAVMWISAANDLLLTFFSVLFLIFWESSMSGRAKRVTYWLALFTFCIALFSKEPSVALVPLAGILALLAGLSGREVLRLTAPLLFAVTAYGVLWIGEAQRNFFVTEKYYALTLQFFPVYIRSFWRVLSPCLLFLIPLLFTFRRGRAIHAMGYVRQRNVLFFLGLIALTIVPSSFLTYLDHVPSRHSYLPSVGLAALIGIFFAALYERSRRLGSRVATVSLLGVVLAGNIGYIWLKKEQQFQSRAAPTRELVNILNRRDLQHSGTFPILVCGFPLHLSIARSAAEEFTPFSTGQIAFRDRCGDPAEATTLEWDSSSQTYTISVPSAFSESRL